MLAALLRAIPAELADPTRLVAHRPLPSTLDPYTLRFTVAARA
jgi:hypothetical protein